MRTAFIFLVVYNFLWSMTANAQESTSSTEAFVRHHSLSLLLGHTQTAQGSKDGKQQWISMPSWALDYNYFLSRRWSLGIHSDVVIESFKVEDHNTHQEVIERTRPIAGILVGSYKFLDAFSAELGFGAEYAKEATFFLTRLGVEYGYELPNAWEVKATVTYDVKWEAYNSISLGVGVGKFFGFKKKR